MTWKCEISAYLGVFNDDNKVWFDSILRNVKNLSKHDLKRFKKDWRYLDERSDVLHAFTPTLRRQIRQQKIQYVDYMVELGLKEYPWYLEDSGLYELIPPGYTTFTQKLHKTFEDDFKNNKLLLHDSRIFSSSMYPFYPQLILVERYNAWSEQYLKMLPWLSKIPWEVGVRFKDKMPVSWLRVCPNVPNDHENIAMEALLFEDLMPNDVYIPIGDLLSSVHALKASHEELTLIL